MADTQDNKKNTKKHWWKRLSFKKLNNRYYFMMSHDDTMEPIVDFRVNLMNLIIITIALAVTLIALTTLIIAFTPLREYIPGYTNTALERDVYALSRRADSIGHAGGHPANQRGHGRMADRPAENRPDSPSWPIFGLVRASRSRFFRGQ